MPCYGATVCKLCHIGICQSAPGDAPEWVGGGPVHFGRDRPLTNLVPDREGLMGLWWSDNLACDGKHLHRRCFAELEARQDEIMRKTSRSTLCAGIRTLLGVWDGVCPSDDESFDPTLPRRIGTSGFFSGFFHQLHVATPPLGFERIQGFRKYMGQACFFDSFVAEGLEFPTLDEVRAVVETMLTGRNWEIGVPTHRCVECMEHRSAAELAVYDSRPEGSLANTIYKLEEQTIRRLGLKADPRTDTVGIVAHAGLAPVGETIIVRTTVNTHRTRPDDLVIPSADRQRIIEWLQTECGQEVDDFKWKSSAGIYSPPSRTIDLVEHVLVAAVAASGYGSESDEPGSESGEPGSESESDAESDAESDPDPGTDDSVPAMHQLSPADQVAVEREMRDQVHKIRAAWEADDLKLERLGRERHAAWVEACTLARSVRAGPPPRVDEEPCALRLCLR